MATTDVQTPIKLETTTADLQQSATSNPIPEDIERLKSFSSLPISIFSQFTPPITDIQNLEEVTVNKPSTVTTTSINSKDLWFSANWVATTATNVSSATKIKFVDFINFNDRSLEVRESRLANAILSLDEDIPQDVDDTILQLIKHHISQKMNSDDHFLEYKNQMAIKRVAERKLPISKAGAARRRSQALSNFIEAF